MIAFGPVPSRRLGFSLGINHIPPKHCPYACVYCQVGATSHMTIKRQAFYPVSEILDEVRKKIEECAAIEQPIDYLTFVPDGEPTLDNNLVEEIDALRPFGIPIAIISNAALLVHREVRDTLQKADWVSLKVDSVNEATWRKINRPHGHLDLETILSAMQRFSADYKGQLVTETMLISGSTTHPKSSRPSLTFCPASPLTPPTSPPPSALRQKPGCMHQIPNTSTAPGKSSPAG